MDETDNSPARVDADGCVVILERSSSLDTLQHRPVKTGSNSRSLDQAVSLDAAGQPTSSGRILPDDPTLAPRPNVVDIESRKGSPDDPTPKCHDPLWDLAVSLIIYVAQLTASLLLIVQYDDHGPNNGHLLLTAALVVFSAGAMSFLSTLMYIEDLEEPDPSVSKLRETFRWLSILFGINPIARFFDALVYGIKRKGDPVERQGFSERHFKREKMNVQILCLVQCAMESAPQLILQFYVISKDPAATQEDPTRLVPFQVASIISSLVSVSWNLLQLEVSIRQERNFLCDGVFFLAHLFGTISRAIALSILPSVCGGWFCIVIFGHWIITGLWVKWKTKKDLLPCLVSTTYYTFSFVESSWDRFSLSGKFYNVLYLAFYFVEDVAFVLAWCWMVWSDPPPHFYAILIGQPVFFLLSLGLMIVVYPRLWPSKGSRSSKLMGRHLRSSLDKVWYLPRGLLSVS